MGSGASRGKKVAPARVSGVNVTKTTVGVTSSKQECRSFKPLEVGAILRNARNRAQPDPHRDGHDSDFSRGDDEVAGGMDTFLTDCEDRERSTVKTNHPKKTVSRSKTYGLCHFGQGGEEEEEEVSSTPRIRTEEASGPLGASRDVNERSRDAFTPNGFLTCGALVEVVSASEKQSTFGNCHSSSLPMPTYDGSEEELMDTIEKEFS
ncbi:uncharacterized protein ACO6RY_06941 [Pungitius sinensis]